ncbi:DUF317 domain-containing protein [Streptomyces lydicus]|uniref:DUF317 domain-containing protein n=1 Tax=Streptomyces lydicus TaxID=47763 RepID=UPI0010119E31|nr:DUF317 domain-containing protein [Streptomyces lydicus]MCZ1006876.1 DUF317 domain-containing protein [Streptomyces lydicus]
MTPSSIDARVRLDTHPTHPSAVIATLTGTQAHIPHMGLEAADWHVVAKNTLVLARIDHEEPYWAADAARELIASGIAVEITPRLREAIDEEWTWADYPMHWCTRTEIREVSAEAQKIYDDIRHGLLLIHAHAHDGHTTVAVGTYLNTGKSIYLHGENHLRQVARTFDSPAKALVDFERIHRDTMRPGPAPLTDTERAAAEARTTVDTPPAEPEPPRPEPETVPSYAADPGDHDALLDDFLDSHGDWSKWRTWSDETTHAIHESQTLRIERTHDVPAHEPAWTIAAYETPVSDRMWHLTATGATPAPVLQELLDHLADGDGWDTAVGRAVDKKAVTASTKPLGWKHTVDGRFIRWTAPSEDTGVQFDVFAAERSSSSAAWTVWAGPSIDRPRWALHASPHVPASMLAGLAAELALGTGTRCHGLGMSAPRQPTPPNAKLPAAAPTSPAPPARRLH